MRGLRPELNFVLVQGLTECKAYFTIALETEKL